MTLPLLTARHLAAAALVVLVAAAPAAAKKRKAKAKPAPAPTAANTEGSAPAPADGPLVVGTKVAPPFSIKGADGSWSGISIDLWRDLAKDLDRDFTFREFDLKGLLDATTKGDVDVGIAAITLTPQRESQFDFSHPYYFTGLGIAVSARPASSSWTSILSPKLGGYLGGLVVLLLVVGVLAWVFERKHNPEQFRPGASGIADGFWWSAVTMTTVGYGDAAPRTLPGRLLGLVWMFAAIILISFFTAGIASSLTVNKLESGITGPADLPKAKVGTIEGSSSARYLTEKGMLPAHFASVSEGLAAVADGGIDAFVYDRPLLQYHVRLEQEGKVRVLEAVFDAQSYGIALPEKSPLREPLNTALLRRQGDERYWKALVAKYLGTDS